MVYTKSNSDFSTITVCMNINLRVIEFVIGILTLCIAYVISETVSGYIRALVAKKCGDSTPERSGFLTLNPFVHIDPVGMFFLIVMGVGWGRYIPLNPYNINPPFERLKITLVYFSDSIVRILLALVALIVLIYSFGVNFLAVAKEMLSSKQIALPLLSYIYPDRTSFELTLAIILAALIYLCVILAVLNFIINGVRLITLFFFHESIDSSYIEFFVPILLILFLADSLRNKTIDLIILIAYHLTRLFGGS